MNEDPFDDIFDLMDRIFGSSRARHSSIRHDKYEKILDGNKIYYTFELRNFNKEDIHIEAKENELYIYLSKPGYGEEKHILELPFPIKPKETKTTFKNGILDVTLVKDTSKSNVIKIDD